MNPFSSNPVEVLEDWNAILENGCCCQMPLCPVPNILRREAQATVGSIGFSRLFIDRQPSDPFVLSEWLNALTYTRTRTRPAPATTTNISNTSKIEYTAGPTTTYVQQETSGHYSFSRVLCLDDEIASVVATTYGGSGTYVSQAYTRPTTSDPWELVSTNTVTLSAPVDPAIDLYLAAGLLDYADPGTPDEPYDIGRFQWTSTISPWVPVETEALTDTLDWAAWLAGAIAILAPPTSPGCYTSSSIGVASTLSVTPPAGWGEDGFVSAKFHEFRWEIPQEWGDAIEAPGHYFLITWDYAFFPQDDPENPVAVALDETWEWIGPGDPEDPDTWLSPWQQIPLPPAAGEVRIVNIRFQCYRETLYGTPPPQVFGEAIDWPEPPAP